MKPMVPAILRAKVAAFADVHRRKDRAEREAEQLRPLIRGTIDYAIFMLDPGGHVERRGRADRGLHRRGNRAPALLRLLPQDAHGFSVRPTPRLIATYRPSHGEVLSVARGLDRDRAVDESGNQIGVFGRVGARPLNGPEQRKMYVRDGKPWTVSDEPADAGYILKRESGIRPTLWMGARTFDLRDGKLRLIGGELPDAIYEDRRRLLESQRER